MLAYYSNDFNATQAPLSLFMSLEFTVDDLSLPPSCTYKFLNSIIYRRMSVDVLSEILLVGDLITSRCLFPIYKIEAVVYLGTYHPLSQY